MFVKFNFVSKNTKGGRLEWKLMGWVKGGLFESYCARSPVFLLFTEPYLLYVSSQNSQF